MHDHLNTACHKEKEKTKLENTQHPCTAVQMNEHLSRVGVEVRSELDRSARGRCVDGARRGVKPALVPCCFDHVQLREVR